MGKIEPIKKKLDHFYSLIKDYEEGAPDTRYKSWEWCHEAFVRNKNLREQDISKEKVECTVDYLSLHLGFYLASWGMYRGSSFLLQRDYKTHKAAVRTILGLTEDYSKDEDAEDYSSLWKYKPESEKDIKNADSLLFDPDTGIYWKVKESYKGVDESAKSIDESSETLTTKILMGTFGCIPAFDRFFKRGIALYKNAYNIEKISNYKLTQSIERKEKNHSESFKALSAFAMHNQKEFDNWRSEDVKNWRSEDVKYPLMKCVDMYFWEIGYEMNMADDLSDKNNKDNEKKQVLLERARKMELCKNCGDEDFEKAAGQIREKNGIGGINE